MRSARLLRSVVTLFLAAGLIGCSTSSAPPIQSAKTGTVAIIGTDAPLASVLAFQVNVTGLTASDGTQTVNLFSGSQTIEFARLSGLRTLLDIQSVSTGKFTSVTATLDSPVISFLDTKVSPPAVKRLNGTLTQSSVTVLLNQPLEITEGGLVALLFDFRLRDSIEVDINGDITGRVVPHLSIRAIPPDAPDAQIDEFRGGVVSVDLAGKKFVMQGPHGRQITVVTDDQTQFEPGEGLDQLDTNTTVQVSGSLQRATLTLKATEVLLLSKHRFLLGGLITDVRPSTGTANEIDLIVRTELPDLSQADVGQISTLGFDGNESFLIHHLRLPISSFLFSRDTLVRGQRITAGGALVTTSNPPALDTRRVWLHHQGVEGGWVPGSTDTFAGTFRLDTKGLTGLLFGQPVKVLVSPLTRFVGLSGLSDLGGTQQIRLRVVGLVLKNASGDPVIVARVVQKL